MSSRWQQRLNRKGDEGISYIPRAAAVRYGIHARACLGMPFHSGGDPGGNLCIVGTGHVHRRNACEMDGARVISGTPGTGVGMDTTATSRSTRRRPRLFLSDTLLLRLRSREPAMVRVYLATTIALLTVFIALSGNLTSSQPSNDVSAVKALWIWTREGDKDHSGRLLIWEAM